MKIKNAVIFGAALFLLSGCSKKQKEENPGGLHISGTIQLDSQLERYTQPSDIIFLIAKPAQGGPPLAVKKLTGRQYPYSFHITEADLMIPQKIPNVPLNITVRVDKDGDAMTKESGDLFGSCPQNPIPLIAQDVLVLISEVVK
jgi:hypothetical protein